MEFRLFGWTMSMRRSGSSEPTSREECPHPLSQQEFTMDSMRCQRCGHTEPVKWGTSNAGAPSTSNTPDGTLT